MESLKTTTNSALIESIKAGFSLLENEDTDTERKIRVSYEIVTPDDAEFGEASDRGWVDDEGVSMEPDEYDIEDGLTAAKLAIKYLLRNGAFEPSNSHGATSTFSDYGGQDNNYETRSYHLVNFTPGELLEITDAVRQRR